MILQEKRIQFLNDTVYYYGSKPNRRAVVGEEWCRTPKYRTEDGRCCAIGRYIPEHLQPKRLSGSVKNLYLGVRKQVMIEHYLPTHIYLLGLNFLTAISVLHDNDFYWNKIGLTYSGQQYYNKIIERFCSDFIEYEDFF